MISAIIFDLGGVLVDWNPRYLYRQLFKTEHEVDWFIANITTLDWNEQHDEGYPIAQGTCELIEKHPEWETYIKAYYDRWTEMFGEPIHGTIKILDDLKQSGKYRLFALTNWSAELFPWARKTYPFLRNFEGIVVSGEEKMRKPQPEIFQLLIDRYKLDKNATLFIDDNLRNVKAAEEFGIRSIPFTTGEELENSLKRLKIL